MSNTFSSGDHTIDSRDICARIEELEAEIENIDDMPEGDMMKNTVESEEARTELKTLKDLVEQIDGYAGDNASDGVQLIRDSYFEETMNELVADCYTLPKDLPSWMVITYDYDALKQDYTSLEFEGITFWFR